MKRRCQVCGGPVVNGRCSLCGMPFRSDEILYHLNENRRDHYSHASSEAKKIMRTQEIPAADRKTRETSGNGGNAAGGKKAGAGNVGTGRAAGTQAMAAGAQKSAARRRTASWVEKERKKASRKERKKSSGVFTLIALVLFLLFSFAGPAAEKLTEWMKSAKTQDDAAYREIMENGTYLGYLDPGQYLWVGQEIPEGSYAIFIEEGYAEFTITGYDAKTGEIRSEKITLDESQPWALTELAEGQKVNFRFADQTETRLEFYQAS